jgi:hypothetical protein
VIFGRKAPKPAAVPAPPAPASPAVPDGSAQAMADFQARLSRHEDLLFGVALFFEGLNVIYAGQDDLIATYRRQFRNVIQSGKEVAIQATTLLEEARGNPGRTGALASFVFALGDGHPQPEELVHRAGVLVDAYNRIFANRPRSQALGKDEVLRLIDSAAEAV